MLSQCTISLLDDNRGSIDDNRESRALQVGVGGDVVRGMTTGVSTCSRLFPMFPPDDEVGWY